MKRTNKKGFTIVELVIVIAVIAILAAVLIPTFSGVINKATDSANLQDASNTYKQLLASEDHLGNLNLNPAAGAADLYIVVGSDKVVYKVVDGKFTKDGSVTAANLEAGSVANYVADTTYTNAYLYEAPAN